jgi:glycosyltransferase involved in cell wall biosynthesis
MILTIGILTKNSEDVIAYALSSILENVKLIDSQEFNTEVIVVDGYSRDRTIDIVMKYKHKFENTLGSNLVNFKILKERINTVGFARKILAEFACGEWILWVDSDNILSKGYIRLGVEKIKNTSQKVAIVYPKHVFPIGFSRVGRLLACYEVCLSKNARAF